MKDLESKSILTFFRSMDQNKKTTNLTSMKSVTSKTRMPFSNLKEFVKEKCITTQRSYINWCKENSVERVRRGIPYEPRWYGKSWSDDDEDSDVDEDSGGDKDEEASKSCAV